MNNKYTQNKNFIPSDLFFKSKPFSLHLNSNFDFFTLLTQFLLYSANLSLCSSAYLQSFYPNLLDLRHLLVSSCLSFL